MVFQVGRTIRDQHITYQRRKDRRKMAEDAYTQKVVATASNDSRAASQSMTNVASTDLAAKRMEPSEFASINDTQVVVNPSVLPEERETAAAMFEIVRRSVLGRNATGQPIRGHQKQIDADVTLSVPMTLTSPHVNADAQAYVAGRSECNLHRTLSENLHSAARNRIPHHQLDHQRLSEISDKILAATREMHQIECELARRQLRLRALNLLVSEDRGHQDINPYGSQSEFPLLGLYCDRILEGGRMPLPAPQELLPTYLVGPPTTAPSIEQIFWLPNFS